MCTHGYLYVMFLIILNINSHIYIINVLLGQCLLSKYLLGLILNILLMIVLCAAIVISTMLRIIYSDCNFSLLAVLRSGIASDLPCTSLISVHLIRPHSDVT